MSRTSARRYPLDPLFELTGWTMTQVRDIAPAGGSEYRLRREVGVTEAIADRLAVAAGLHPHLIWPDMADHVISDNQRECAAEDCSTLFVPRSPLVLYCSQTCRRRMKARRYRSTERGAEVNRRHRRAYYWECREYDLAQSRARRERQRTQREEAA